MAKQLIATLVTNSNGEAFYNYTGTGSGQTTFIAESGELESNSLTINDIDWSQSRIIFVSPIFTPYQLNATDFKNIPVDLIKVTRYENDIVDIDFIRKTSNVKIEEFGGWVISHDKGIYAFEF